MLTIPFKSDTETLHKADHYSGNLFDLLPKGQDSFIFKDLIEQLDTSEIESKFSPKGQHAYHPKKIGGVMMNTPATPTAYSVHANGKNVAMKI